MLNSVEHEILNAHKYKNIKKFGFFSGSGKPKMLSFLPINVKMHFNIYEQEKFHAQMSWAWKMFHNLGSRFWHILVS